MISIRIHIIYLNNIIIIINVASHCPQNPTTNPLPRHIHRDRLILAL
jgi:hypothetical protein